MLPQPPGPSPGSACAWLRPTPGYSVHLKLALAAFRTSASCAILPPARGDQHCRGKSRPDLAYARGQLRPAASEVQGAAVRTQSGKQEKASCVGKRLFRGRASGFRFPSSDLLRRRLLVLTHGSGWRARRGSELLQIVLQEADFHAPTTDALVLAFLISVSRLNRSIAHTDHENPVHRNVVVEHEVAHHGIRHLLRSSDRGLTTARGEALHFDDVAALVLQWGGYVIQSGFGVLA